MNAKRKTERSQRKTGKAPWLIITSGAAAVIAAMALWMSVPTSSAEAADIVVYKTPSCGCCGKWIAHLRDAGLNVSIKNTRNTQAIQSQVGVPREMGSCHTAIVGNYWVEGHVPVDLIQRLMTEKPDNIRGIAVPGMIIGSPGMEGPNPADYQVIALTDEGRTTVYAKRHGQTAP